MRINEQLAIAAEKMKPTQRIVGIAMMQGQRPELGMRMADIRTLFDINRQLHEIAQTLIGMAERTKHLRG